MLDDERADTPSGDLPATPGIEAQDTLAEVARKTLRFHFLRMVAHEDATLDGRDIEALHDMRVATRRMRTALRVFESYLDPDMVAPWIEELRRTGRCLGTVRDMDIFREKTEAYLQQVAIRDNVDLSPLMRAWDAAHTTARHALLDLLESRRYRRFRRTFSAMLATPFPSVHPAVSTADSMGEVLIRQRLAIVYGYEARLSASTPPLTLFHQLRIDVKNARYLFEFLREILRPDAEAIIRTLRELQDHLGALQDAVVACEHIEHVLRWGIWDMPRQPHTLWCSCPVNSSDVIDYLEHRRAEIATLVAGFPEAWAQIRTPAFRASIDRALSTS